MLLNNDISKLLLRLGTGALMLSHGIAKLQHGIGGVKTLVTGAGLPELLAYGVYAGELLAPVLIILGYFSRIGALLLSVTMAVAIYLAHGDALFALTRHGAPAVELPLLYLLLGVVIFLSGPGKYAINRN